jgi:hypothetical protein
MRARPVPAPVTRQTDEDVTIMPWTLLHRLINWQILSKVVRPQVLPAVSVTTFGVATPCSLVGRSQIYCLNLQPRRWRQAPKLRGTQSSFNGSSLTCKLQHASPVKDPHRRKEVLQWKNPLLFVDLAAKWWWCNHDAVQRERETEDTPADSTGRYLIYSKIIEFMRRCSRRHQSDSAAELKTQNLKGSPRYQTVLGSHSGCNRLVPPLPPTS